ncbi:MAG: D-glycero-beta-D-manno-heptose 1-phosphate adenylyltransferase [Candidatus Cloacimonadaceae bacterium]|nr:D-glycero-beta-D-manno-heptose 1-phosphate adenylyltransferase [Candidatus Cloacimonadota bacterium]MDX9950183.1 D-glycero-beta-D-manno-heptose 1-phosphate adenylyltransferase [Candidatus Syntrophosphaera sp.]
MIKNKIKNWDEAAFLASELQAQGGKVVFTNGCFDLIHAGHVQYLEQAKALGDVLIVGMNSDSSVRGLKGKTRPLVKEEDRAMVLAALQSVDIVVVFNQETPLKLIEHIRPDVLVKGGDWEPGQIVGADFVLAGGGLVKSLPFREGISTTDLIKRAAILAEKEKK